MLCGTGHVVYTMLPIIYDVAIKNGIRPERPMAGVFHRQPDGHHRQPGVGGRGVAGGLPGQGAGRRHRSSTSSPLLSITIPSTLAGVLMIGIFSWFRGKDLDKDDDFQALIANPERASASTAKAPRCWAKLTRSQWTAMWIFVGAIAWWRCWAPSRNCGRWWPRQAAVDGADDPDVHADGRCADRSSSPRPTRRRSARTRSSAPA
jgi:anaerobic C4-dicarboxylate transporter DcuB